MGCSPRTRCYTTLGFGIAFIILGLVLIIVWPFVFKLIMESQFSLQPDSKAYEMWKDTPIPMYMDVYMFNWTNAEEVANDWSIKPKFEELGPYVFSEHHTKVNISWNSNDTVTFQQVRVWHFLPELSQGSLDDEITNVNAVAATVAYIVRNKHFVIQRVLDLIMREKKEKLITTKKVRELLFDGYDDELLKLVKEINMTGIDVPFTKFGWFAERNESATFDGIFNMYTGVDSLENVGMMDRWNSYSNVPYYPGECGRVFGSTGELWPPVVGNQSIHMFASDMCSTVTLDHDGSSELHGIEGTRFVATKKIFDNGRYYPEQSCFDLGGNVPTGVRNVSQCRFGAPAFLSLPHFYLADPYFGNAVDGMKPNKTIHELYVDLEENTGLPLNVRARAQINIMVQPIRGIKMYEHITRTFLPILWFENRATLTSDYASLVKVVLVLPNLGLYTGTGLGSVGLLILFVVAMVTIRQNWKGTDQDKLITSAESTSSFTTT